MFDKIIAYSIDNKLVVGLSVLALVVWGIFSMFQLPIDAVPDITNNQVQVITTSPSLATQEVEQFISTPVERSLQNIQQVVELRSISRFGLSVVTVVFEEDMDIYLARQLVSEHLKEAEENIPEGLGTPELAPISTGLGEIYQYVVRAEEEYKDSFSLSELRSIQDWIIKKQLSGIEGVVEINTLGGHLKQYEVAVDPDLLKSMKISIRDIYDALQNSNENTGGAYIEKNPNTYFIRTNGIAQSLSDIENIVVDVRSGRPILIRDVATVQFGRAPRYGAVTRNGDEVVGGMVMMLKGENSAKVTEKVKKRIIQIQKTLPEGVIIDPFLDREKLVSTAIGTVKKNLLEGGLIVIFILVLMLGNFRAGLIVASVIPLSMLFAISFMNVFGISANLMSLGAIDFGLIIDGAVIIVESIVHRLKLNHSGKLLSVAQMDQEVKTSSQKIRSSAAFGEIIILIVYIPILALVGIEGAMFRPMAQTVMLAISGALILSLTYVPMMAALFLNKNVDNKRTLADRIIAFFQNIYTPMLNFGMKWKKATVIFTIILFGFSIFQFSRMGGEFIPTLEEGDLALHQILPPGSSLSQSIEISKIIQDILIEEFPEVEEVVTKIGSSEIPTDPMPVETGDIMVIMKPKKEWVSAKSRQEMFVKMEHALEIIPGLQFEFTQPIQMRFNELMTGSRADIAIKLFGDDPEVLYEKAIEAEQWINKISGAGTVKVEQTLGLPQIIINFKYDKMAQYGLQVKEVNQIVRAAFAGEIAGTIYEGDRRFDLVVRLEEQYRNDISDVQDLYITLENGTQVPLREVANVEMVDGPMQTSRENTNRRIVIGVNVGDTDVASLVNEIQSSLDENMDLPPGYYFEYGGQFENLKEATKRLAVAVPIALALILILLYFTFGSLSQAFLVFTAIPLSAIGGIWSLQLRDMPFSISAGIGFIALFGVAVLNGIVLISYFNQLKKEGVTNIYDRIYKGTSVRLRPVIMTAAVASLGFLPMALSTSGGAEVQRPLATVVIGGLITATFLTLIVLPILYSWLSVWKDKRADRKLSRKTIMVLVPLFFISTATFSQSAAISLDEAVSLAIQNNDLVKAAQLETAYQKTLQNMPYRPGKTGLYYEADGMFRENPQQMSQVRLSQAFKNPKHNRAFNKVQDHRVSRSDAKRMITEMDMRKRVQEVYAEFQHAIALREVYDTLTVKYDIYVAMASKRVELGAVNKIELLSLESKRKENEWFIQKIDIQILGLSDLLALMMGVEGGYYPSDTFSMKYPRTLENADPIVLQGKKEEISMFSAAIDQIKANNRPDFYLSYALQNYVEEPWLYGIQAGIEMPLFNTQNKKKLQAQKVQVTLAEAAYKAQKNQLDQRHVELRNILAKSYESTIFFEEQLEIIIPELERISEMNYRAGEISYLELLNVIQLYADNKTKFLEQILENNKAFAAYEFLTK